MTHPFRFGIVHLLVITTFAVLAAWAVANPSNWVHLTVTDFASLTLVAAIIGACVTDGATRAFWIAYAATLYLSDRSSFPFIRWFSEVGEMLGESMGVYAGTNNEVAFRYLQIWSLFTSIFVSLIAAFISRGMYIQRRRSANRPDGQHGHGP